MVASDSAPQNPSCRGLLEAYRTNVLFLSVDWRCELEIVNFRRILHGESDIAEVADGVRNTWLAESRVSSP